MEEINAIAQTGPKTLAGKATSSRNAVKHGILAAVMPHEEEAYADHLAAVRTDRAPVGYLEEVLTDRIALTLWRLGRVATYEAAESSERSRRTWERASGQTKDPNAFRSPELATLLDREGLQRGDGTIDYEGLEQLPTDAENAARLARLCHFSAREEVDNWLEEIETWSQQDRYEVATKACLELDDHEVNGARVLHWKGDWSDYMEFSATDLVRLLEKLGKVAGRYGGTNLEKGLWQVYIEFGRESERQRQNYHRIKAMIFETKGASVLPTGDQLAKIAKYEAHLERILYRAIHELEALQDKRQGKTTPLARVELHGGAD